MGSKAVCSLIAKLWLDALREDQPLKSWCAANLGREASVFGGESPHRMKSAPDAPFIVVDVVHGAHGTRLEDYQYTLRVSMGVAIKDDDPSPDAVHDVFRLLDTGFASEVLAVLEAAHPDLEFVHVAYVYEDAYDPLFCLELEITVLVPKVLAGDIILTP